VHDLRHPSAIANPDVPLDHPLQLVTDAAFHGGLCACRLPALGAAGRGRAGNAAD